MGKLCYGCMKEINNTPVCPHCGYRVNQISDPHCLPAGTVLQRQYLIGKVLGQGGFGITYMGWDAKLEQPLAIKEFYPMGFVTRDSNRSLYVTECGSNVTKFYEEYKQRFLKEARTLAKLRNIPQIVHVLNYFEENNTAYIVMEFVEGTDLRKYLQRRGHPLSAMETLSILAPVMDALSKVHETGLIHRDIRPDNMMLLPDGSIKLLDFGASRMVENPDVNGMLSTSTKAIMKPGFAPVEQYQSRGALGPWTDVYAMCATIYYCMTMTVPPESVNQLMDGTSIPWNKLHGMTSGQLAALQKGMALRPNERFQSIRHLQQALTIAAPQKPKPADFSAAPIVKPSAPPAAAQTPESHPDDCVQWKYRNNDTGLTVSGFSQSKSSYLVLPSRINGLPVTAIDSRAFYNCENITEVIIPSGVTSIGYLAFGECKNLQKVTIPNTVSFIDGEAFKNTPWYNQQNSTFVIVGDGVLLKYNGTASHVEIPHGVKMISSAFYQKGSIGSVSIPKTVTALGVAAFLGCTNLKWIELPEGMTYISASAFFNCKLLSTVIIPKSVKELRYQAFEWCPHLQSITVSKDCKIGERAIPKGCFVRHY